MGIQVDEKGQRYFILGNGKRVDINYPTPATHPIEETRGPAAEIVRMDFFALPAGGFVVNKLAEVTSGRLSVLTGDTKDSSFDLEKALEWCRSNGWKVRRWPGGARAWKYAIAPVRTESEIKKLRLSLISNPRPELQGQGNSLDLAYDL